MELSRLPRLVIDDFSNDNQPPEPPKRKVQVFGGVEEEIDDLKDDRYLKAMQAYYLMMGDKMIDVIAPAVEIIDPVESRTIQELEELGINAHTVAAQLRFLYLDDDDDFGRVTGLVWYLSTVTPRGLVEASNRFNVRWQGKQLSPFSGGFAGLKASAEFNQRRAALRQGYDWHRFCELTGPEQCRIVVMDGLENKIQKIMSG